MRQLLLSLLLPALVASQCSNLPLSPPLPSNPKLPDPFKFLNGTTVTTLDAWTCRQQEINALFQRYELGTLPPAPETFTSSLTTLSSTSSRLTLNAGNDGTTISWSVTISYPNTGTAPFPALIVLDGLSIPQPAGVAIITLSEGTIAQQNSGSSRGVGEFYTLFGQDASAGALMAWAWAVSRMIDALESTPVSQTKIDTSRIGITGCSRDGKGAMVAGAFEPRIALTIVQESGSGGAACWRLSDAEDVDNTVQTASEIVQENVWFSPNFNVFASGDDDTTPFDHHMLAGLIAPRALFVIENLDFLWLGPESTFGCMKTAQKIWEALGVPDRMGFSQVGNHSHCQFPVAVQGPELDAFIGKFLLGNTGEDTSEGVTTTGDFTFNETRWIDWSVPDLSK